MALQGINYVAPLLVWPYLMVTLGAEKFGYIGFSQSINFYLVTLVEFGFNLITTKKIALAQGNQTEIDRIFSSTFLAKIGLTILAGLLLLGVMCVPKFAEYRATLAIFFAMVVANTLTFTWLFQGLGKIRTISIVNCVAKISILPLTFVFVKSPDDVLIAAAIQAAVYLVSAIATIIIAARKRLMNFVKTSLSESWHELKDSFPIFVSQAASSVYVTFFVLILGYFATADEVGRYAAAEKMMRIACNIIWIPISQAFFPRISQLSQSNRAAGIRLTKWLSVGIFGTMLCVGFIFFFFAEPLAIWLGKGYNGMGQIAQIIAFTPIFISLGGLFGQLGLLALGNESDKRHYRNVYIAAAIVAAILVVVLIPIWHATGAAVALIITEFCVFAGMSFGVVKMLKKR